MKIKRTLPPAASPIYLRDIINGFRGIILGQREIERFRSELKDHFGVKHCFLVSSGKAALTLILRALSEMHPDRDEVLIPAFCCYSVPSAIVRAGLKVKLCDVNPDTLDYDYNQLEAILNKQQLNESCNFKKSNETDNKPQAKYYNKPQQAISNSRFLAVLGIHLFGLLSDIEQIQKLVGDPAVSVVEDTAQAMGSEKNDKLLGTHGEVGFFSLGRGKPLSGVEGGIIITNKDDLAEAINRMFPKVHGYNVSEHIKLILNAFALLIFQRPHFFWFPKSLAFLRVGDTFYDPHFKIRKLSAFQSGLVKNWREKLAKFQNDRRENTMQWHSIAKLSNIHQYCSQNGNFLPLLKYPVIIENKKMLNMILEESDKNGHGIMLTYPDSINGIDELIELFKGQNFPAAKNLPHQLLTLPVHPYVKRQDMEKISKLFSKAENHVKQVRCV